MPTDTFFLRDVPQTPKEPIRAETMSHPKRNSRARLQQINTCCQSKSGKKQHGMALGDLSR